MKTTRPISSALIAPCGMNCGICLGYLREKNVCLGCRSSSLKSSHYFSKCIIKNCENFKDGKKKFCFQCSSYPCRRLKNLDKRYRNYGMSMLENLDFIKQNGIRKFVKKENQRWLCPECHSSICVHRPACLNCGTSRKF